LEEEADESSFWIELLVEAGKLNGDQAVSLLKESNELVQLSVASIRTPKRTANQTNPRPPLSIPHSALRTSRIKYAFDPARSIFFIARPPGVHLHQRLSRHRQIPIATVVSTKVLTPRQAVMLAAVTNLIGAFFGTAVAATIASGLVDAQVATMPCCAVR